MMATMAGKGSVSEQSPRNRVRMESQSGSRQTGGEPESKTHRKGLDIPSIVVRSEFRLFG